MPSSTSTRNRLSLSESIRRKNHINPSPCDYCFSNSLTCFTMPSNPKLKCSECTRRGRPCAANSLEALDVSEENLQQDLNRDEEEREQLLARLAELQSRVARKRKVLEQARRRAEDARNCLIREMEAEGEDLSRVAYDAALFEASSDDFGGFGNAAFVGTPSAVPDTR